MDDTMPKTLYVQLMVLEEYDKNLFEPVTPVPQVKIYTLKV